MYSSFHTLSNAENNPQAQNEYHEGSYYVVLTASLLEDQNLTDSEKLTFTTLSNFWKKDGYATCSDQWLSTKRNCSDSKIKRELKNLEKKGYIWRETIKDGMYWHRKIWLAEAYISYLHRNQKVDEKFNKCLRRVKSDTSEGSKVTLPKGQIWPNNNISTKYKKGGIRARETRRDRPPDSGPPPPSKKSFGKVVKLDPHEYDELTKIYGKKVIDHYIQKMDDYLVYKEKTYQDYFKELKWWLHQDKIPPDEPPEPQETERYEANQQFWESSLGKYPHLQNQFEERCWGIVHLPTDRRVLWNFEKETFKQETLHLLRKIDASHSLRTSI